MFSRIISFTIFLFLFFHSPAYSRLIVTNVHVVPMTSEIILAQHSVIIKDDTVQSVLPDKDYKPLKEDKIIDAKGAYLLPGFKDMHVHLYDESYLLLLIANGVTTVRNMWGTPQVLDWKNEIKHKVRIGPQIYTAGPILDGDPPLFKKAYHLTEPSKVNQTVKEQKLMGYDFLKIYDRISLPVFKELLVAAKKHNLPIVGHVPFEVGLEQILKTPISSTEHLYGYAESILKNDSKLIGQYSRETRYTAYADIDPLKLKSLATRHASTYTWITPTLYNMDVIHNAKQAQKRLANDPYLKKLPAKLLNGWKKSIDKKITEQTAADLKIKQIAIAARKKIFIEMHQANNKIMLGTDTPNTLVIPGRSVHDELALMVNAGLTPYQALLTATRNAGEYLKSFEKSGTLTKGSVADLILLNKNPFSNIENTRSIRGVVLKGVWHSKENLDKLVSDQVKKYK